jgi:DNA polymerase III delta subunit
MSHIHIFTGTDTIALHIALAGYIEEYSSTYGAENVYTIDVSTADISDLERDIYSPSLFSPYRLFVLRGISLVSKSKNTDTETEDIQAEIDIPESTYGIESLLEKIVDSPYPDSTIYIVSPQIDSRKKITKKITDIKNVEVHTYIYPTTPTGISSMLQSQYTDISRDIIIKIM